jgi:hypothetical protein
MSLSPNEMDDFIVRPFTQRAVRFLKKLMSKKSVTEEDAIKAYFNLPSQTRITINSRGQRVAHWPNGGTSIIPNIPKGVSGVTGVTAIWPKYATAVDPRVSVDSYNPGYHNSKL